MKTKITPKMLIEAFLGLLIIVVAVCTTAFVAGITVKAVIQIFNFAYNLL